MSVSRRKILNQTVFIWPVFDCVVFKSQYIEGNQLNGLYLYVSYFSWLVFNSPLYKRFYSFHVVFYSYYLNRLAPYIHLYLHPPSKINQSLFFLNLLDPTDFQGWQDLWLHHLPLRGFLSCVCLEFILILSFSASSVLSIKQIVMMAVARRTVRNILKQGQNVL